MNTNQTLEKLIRGSQNLDHMKDVVDQVVKQVLGFVNANYKGFRELTEELFDSETCQWVVFTDVMNVADNKLKLKACCWVKDEHGHINHVGYLGYHSERDSRAPAVMIQPVYESLAVFLEGMLRVFPELPQYWKPLIKASAIKVVG